MDLVRQSEVSASQFGVLPLRFMWLGKARVRFNPAPITLQFYQRQQLVTLGNLEVKITS